MLAEELMQVASRKWNDRSGCLVEPSVAEDEAFLLNCAAATVLCGLATLHADSGYRRQAVIRDDASYGDAAERILAVQQGASLDSCSRSGAYGLALLAKLKLQSQIENPI
jgi:hypothetical protein